jgi:glycosyltransferase involved in cell wall biosynthesis
MACGCPVVASDIVSLKERCGDAAVYCNPHSVDSITAAVERVMDDDALREALRTAGLKRAAKFTWDDCARRTLEVIRDTAEAKA